MNELIEQLKELRKNEQKTLNYIQEFQEKLEETDEWSELQIFKISLLDIQAEIKFVDENLRQAALTEYYKTNNKKPTNGVSIIIKKVIKYSVDKAVQWAKENAPNMITLDIRAFEKHARAVQDTVPLEFVQVSEEPGVRIAKEL